MRCQSMIHVLGGTMFAVCFAPALSAEEAALHKTAGGNLSVRDYGAVGDGKVDDAPAIQKAVDSRQGDIRFDRGVYRITQPIRVELDKVGPTAFVGTGTARIAMDGPGPAIRFVGTLKGTADPKTIQPEVWRQQRTPAVVGMEIVGLHPEADGIEADGTMQLTLDRLDIRQCRHAVHLVGRNRNVIASNCHLYGNMGVGLFLDNVSLHQINVNGCHISYNRGGGIVSRSGDVRNLHITGCDVESNMSADTPPTANVLIDCTGSDAGTAEVAVTGCTLQHNSNGPDSANIRFIGPEKKERRWGHLALANNILSDVRMNVDIQNARGVSIVGNSFGKAGRYDLRMVGCTNVVIGPNVLDRNPEYGSAEASADGRVLLKDCTDSTISGLHVNAVRRASAGVVLEDCRRIHITGCSILDCDNAGVMLKNCLDSRVAGCIIRNELPGSTTWTAVKVEGGKGNVVFEDEK